MKKVAIIDYGLCNLDSISRAVEECGGKPSITDQRKEIETATHLILPGVGAFNYAMENLREKGLPELLTEQVVGKQVPFLGICLGMQLLATKGYEGGETAGLGWISGEVRRLKSGEARERIPHVGWDEVYYQKDCPLFAGIPPGKDFYFVHSYHFCCYNESDIVAYTPYCSRFVSGIALDLIFGVQFHPEKSQRLGFQVLRNFLAL